MAGELSGSRPTPVVLVEPRFDDRGERALGNGGVPGEGDVDEAAGPLGPCGVAARADRCDTATQLGRCNVGTRPGRRDVTVRPGLRDATGLLGYGNIDTRSSPRNPTGRPGRRTSAARSDPRGTIGRPNRRSITARPDPRAPTRRPDPRNITARPGRNQFAGEIADQVVGSVAAVCRLLQEGYVDEAVQGGLGAAFVGGGEAGEQGAP